MSKSFQPTWSVLVSLVLLVLAFPAHAQQPPADLSIHVTGADVAAFPQVALTVTVRDANGVPVPDLDGRAFEVNEDRAPEARPIAAVEPLTNPDLPVGLVLVVDISGSMAGQPLADAQAAARANVPVFTIGLGSQIDRGYLERVAQFGITEAKMIKNPPFQAGLSKGAEGQI